MEGLNNMRNLVTRFVKDEGGASAVEYSVLLALIAAALIVSVTALGVKIQGVFTGITALI
jgi:pilus assembly protein Flp/PilA